MKLIRDIKKKLSRKAVARGEGFVLQFNRVNGYGFIWCEKTHQELFVHRNFICRESGATYLIRDQRVSFEIVETLEGMQAKNVTSEEFLPHQLISSKGGF